MYRSYLLRVVLPRAEPLLNYCPALHALNRPERKRKGTDSPRIVSPGLSLSGHLTNQAHAANRRRKRGRNYNRDRSLTIADVINAHIGGRKTAYRTRSIDRVSLIAWKELLTGKRHTTRREIESRGMKVVFPLTLFFLPLSFFSLHESTRDVHRGVSLRACAR